MLSIAALGAVLACASTASHAAHAGHGETYPAWTFGGFGSIGAVHASIKSADFSSTILKAKAAGYSDDWSPHVDSRLGAQLGVTLNKQWSGVIQVISEQGYHGNYKPIVEWANIKYQATPDLSLRFGRIALPIFLAADYRKVGYAYPWVRTPVEVYGTIPVTNSDGIDATYRWNRGSLKNVTQAFFGHTEMGLTQTAHLDVRSLAGVSNTAEYGAASVRLSALSSNMTLDVARPLFDAFRQFGARGAALADRYDVDHKRVTALSVGASYDPGNWFAMCELARMRTNSFIGTLVTGYASAGYRLGDFTPYLSYARVSIDSATSDPGLPLANLPPALAATAANLNGYLNGLFLTIPVQSTFTAGARWDVRPDVALKLQYDRVVPRDGSRGTLINVQPGFQSGRAVHVASVVLDFVF